MIRGQSGTVKLARKLRAEMTPPEIALWQALRTRPGGYKFRRQHPAGIYVLDFFCTKARLAIEVDGSAHDSAKVIAKDAARSRFLRDNGITTTRNASRQNLCLKILMPWLGGWSISAMRE